MFELTSTSPQQTLLIGKTIATCLEPGDCLALDGELGTGKTQLVRGIASGLNIDPHQVASPTFVVMHEYAPEAPPEAPPPPEAGDCEPINANWEASGGGGPWLIHIDAYRLQDASELDQLGWKDEQDQTIMVIEWAERVAEALPDDRLAILISHGGLEQRNSLFTGHGRWAKRLEILEQQLRAFQ